MKMHFRTYLLYSIGLVLFFTSCSKTNKQGKLIPKDAMVVFHINGASLFEKLTWEDIKQNSIFQEVYADKRVEGYMKSFLDNPDNGGINIKSDLLFFGVKDSLGLYFALEGDIKDATKFESLVKNLAEKKGSLTEKDGIKYITEDGNGKATLAWNKEKFIFLVSDKNDAYNYSYKMNKDTEPRNLMATCTALFELKSKNSLSEDEKFSALMKKEGDIHIWVNIEAMQNNTLSGGLSSLFNFDDIYKGSRVTATVNFEKGKIKIDSKNYVNKDLGAIYEKYEGKGISEEMLKRIPAQNIMGLFAMNYKPEGIKEMIKLYKLDGAVSLGMAFLGFSMDDFIKANKGDFVLAVTDVKEERNATLYSKKQPEVLFATSIGDKDAFNLMVKAIKKMSSDELDSNLASSIYYNLNDNYFAIGNNKENVDKYLSGSNSNFEFIKEISGYPIAGYVDFQYMLSKIDAKSAMDSSMKELSVKTWQDAFLKGGKYNDGGLTFTFELNLINKEINSAKQLSTYLSSAAVAEKENRKKMIEDLGKQWQDKENKTDSVKLK